MNEADGDEPVRTSDSANSAGLLCTLLLFAPFKTNPTKHAQAIVHPICLPLRLLLTNFGHLRNGCLVGPIQKLRLVVVDVLDFDDELRLGLQRPVRQAVAGLSTEDVLGLHLPVQPLDGMDVPCAVVNGEGGAGTLACQYILNGPVAFIHVRVKLWRCL